MAAECMEEDLLGDVYCKDFGELEDLDDDAENALLGDSDDEGGGKQRNSAMTTVNRQQYGEEEYEYVDEDGNVVDIRDNENFEYVEITQDNSATPGVDDSGNDDVLELVVDPDLEFDDSVAQDSQSDELQSGTPEPLSHQEQKKPHAKQRLGALPHTKHTPNFQQDGFDKQPKSLQQLPFQTSTYINSKSQDQSSSGRSSAISSQSLRDKANPKVIMRNNSCDTDEGNYEQSDNFDSRVESSESEEEEENSGRGRFRTERPNIVQLCNAKKRSNIPDSLDLVISHEEVSRIERSNRHSKRCDYGKNLLKDQDRHKEKTRPKDKDKSRIKEHRNDDSFKDISNNAQRPPPLLGNVPGYLSTIDSSLSSGHPNVPSIVNQKEAKGPRKILINPHFKGGMGTSSGVASPALWNNKPVNSPFSNEHHNNSLNSLFPPSQAPHMPHSNTFNSSFNSPVHRLPNQVPITQIPPPQFQFPQPPVKPNPEFQNFQRPPSLMSIQSHISLPNNMSSSNNNNNNSLIGPPPVPLFPPPRDHPPPNMHFNENRALEIMPGQFQDHSSNSHWNQHQPPGISTFKPFNASSGPLPLNFPPNSQQPLFSNPPQPSNFGSVQRSQLPVFRAQLVPQNIRLPSPHGPFTTPPPNFNARMELQAIRPLDRNWQTQQPRPRMAVPIPPNFREPPPPIGVNPPSNPPFPNPSVQFNRNLVNVHGMSQENNNTQPLNQFSPIRVHTLPPYKQMSEDNNFRPSGLKQNHNQTMWVDKNVRPVKVNMLQRKRNSEDGPSMATLMKQARLSVKVLQNNRRKPLQINTNIKQVEIVDQLPVIQAPTSANIDVTIKDVKATDQKEAQPEKTTQKDASENVAKTETQIDDDEDEETKQYRQKIELQKKRREEILRLKEQRRIIMAHQRRKQMMASQQQQHLSEDVTQNESLIPLITGISTPLVKPVTSVPTNNSTIGKKRIVVRRVPCRGYHLLRKKPNICTNKEELSSHSTVTTRQIIDHSSSVFSGNITESDESVIQESQNASNSTLHLKNVEQGFQQKSLVHKRIVRRIPKTIQDENHQQASLKTVRTLTQGQKVGQRTVITSTDVNNDQNLTRVQIKNVIGGAIQKLPLEKKMTISAQPGSSNKISLTTSQRQVAYQDQAPRRNFNPSTAMVRIENLSVSTGDLQLRKMCQSVGPVESISVCKEKRTANIKFKNVQHAKQFLDKYQRKMVDLSLITITLIS